MWLLRFNPNFPSGIFG